MFRKFQSHLYYFVMESYIFLFRWCSSMIRNRELSSIVYISWSTTRACSCNLKDNLKFVRNTRKDKRFWNSYRPCLSGFIKLKHLLSNNSSGIRVNTFFFIGNIELLQSKIVWFHIKKEKKWIPRQRNIE